MKRFSIVLLFYGFLAQSQEVTPVLSDLLGTIPNVRDFTISQDQEEFYATAQSPLGEISVVVRGDLSDSKWSLSIASFSGSSHDMEPFLSPDELKLYFVSNRTSAVKAGNDYDIWYTQRASDNDPWAEPANLGAPVNSTGNEFYPSVANNGNLYFTSDGQGSKGKDDIFFAEMSEGSYAQPLSLGYEINSEGYEFNAYIDPTESFLIYTAYNRADGLGSGDLYISTRATGREWTPARNMGAVNSSQMDYCPYYDSQRQILYFTSRRSDMSKTSFDNISELLMTLTKVENGLSRVYAIHEFQF